MIPLLIVIHIAVCIIMILIVLLQGGKGADIGASFGGASQTVFGSTGPTDFMGKLTTWSAAIFMITSLSLAYLSGGSKASSVVNTAPLTSEQQASKSLPAPEGIDQTLPPIEQKQGVPESPAPSQEKGPAPKKEAK